MPKKEGFDQHTRSVTSQSQVTSRSASAEAAPNASFQRRGHRQVHQVIENATLLRLELPSSTRKHSQKAALLCCIFLCIFLQAWHSQQAGTHPSTWREIGRGAPCPGRGQNWMVFGWRRAREAGRVEEQQDVAIEPNKGKQMHCHPQTKVATLE